MLPEQGDILWTFCTILFTVFALYAFINVVSLSRERDDVNTKFWGGIFGAFLLVMFLEAAHMFSLNQQEQLAFFFGKMVLTIFLLLLTWGIFFKSTEIENQSPPIIRAFFWWTTISVLLAGYTNWLPQQRSDPPPKATAFVGEVTMEEYAEMGRVIIFGTEQIAGQKAIGKGQCPLCHTFEAGNNIGRCPNLFGVGERGFTRVKEDRYLNEPVKVGELEPKSGIVKGAPDQIPEEYRREGAGGHDSMTAEDYIRESVMCPSCYVVKGFGKAGDKVSPMPVITKPPISLSPIEVNAVIAYLQSYNEPGDYSKVTVPLPSADEGPTETAEDEGDAPIFVTGAEPIGEMINTLGCPLCHTIPGIEGAEGELGPKLHEKVNAPKRIKDPRYKGKAKNTKEYVRESILNPNAYIVMNEEENELFPEGLMPQDFKNKLSVDAIDKLVDFISQTEG
ncbi:MAG TPA: cytochrome C [Nitrospinaceae bacterium]|jgi:cytochrome c2|nr:cytochrome C [Nitrospinaceae bacterium]